MLGLMGFAFIVISITGEFRFSINTDNRVMEKYLSSINYLAAVHFGAKTGNYS
jgi:hypothetical protein